MAKRKEPDTPSKARSTPRKRQRKETEVEAEEETPTRGTSRLLNVAGSWKGNRGSAANGTTTPSKSTRFVDEAEVSDDGSDEREGSPTPKAGGVTAFVTPTKKKAGAVIKTPGSGRRADRSAKRKSAQTLLEGREEEDWDHGDALAHEILSDNRDDDEEEEDEDNEDAEPEGEEIVVSAEPAATTAEAVTPSKRGRPKGSRNKRSPTPEGDLPPEERYFFQSRSGPARISSNTLASSIKLLTHEEYFEQIKTYRDHHEPEKKYLMKLHARAFPQWRFEMDQGFNLCLYGWGSKRMLVNRFAEWVYSRLGKMPRIVIVNGYTPKISIRSVLSTTASALVGKDEEMRLVGQPQEMLDTLLDHLSTHVDGMLVVMINSIDALSLRKPAIQAVLARLAAHPQVNLVATADTPTFPVLWSSAMKDQFNFVFHDCTTFAPYDVEISVVDEVHDLLGRKGRRLAGREGIGFVLRSLPENARNLYRVLLTEILAILTDGIDGVRDDDADDGEEGQMATSHKLRESAEMVGIEYRTLYQKASEEFICSSDMNFRFLLKEFHDHQMITSRRDASGTELLGVPLGQGEMEAVLEDLVIG